MKLNGKKALLIGGFGFIGLYLCKALLSKGTVVTVVDRGNKKQIPKINVIQTDATDVESYKEAIINSDLILNFVWYNGEDSDESERINYKLPKDILEMAKQSRATVIHLGTRLQYGEVEKTAKETDDCNPTILYGIHSLAAEKDHIAYYKKFGVKIICFRISPVYGPGENKGIISKIISTLKKGETFTIFGEDNQTKDFLYIDDLVRAILSAIANEECFGGVFNLGSGEQTDFIRAVNKIQKLVGKGKVARDKNTPCQGPSRFSLDIEKIKKITGWQPQVTFEEGIKLTVEGK